MARLPSANEANEAHAHTLRGLSAGSFNQVQHVIAASCFLCSGSEAVERSGLQIQLGNHPPVRIRP